MHHKPKCLLYEVPHSAVHTPTRVLYCTKLSQQTTQQYEYSISITAPVVQLLNRAVDVPRCKSAALSKCSCPQQGRVLPTGYVHSAQYMDVRGWRHDSIRSSLLLLLRGVPYIVGFLHVSWFITVGVLPFGWFVLCRVAAREICILSLEIILSYSVSTVTRPPRPRPGSCGGNLPTRAEFRGRRRDGNRHSRRTWDRPRRKPQRCTGG